jgi:hypothetical protein
VWVDLGLCDVKLDLVCVGVLRITSWGGSDSL